MSVVVAKYNFIKHKRGTTFEKQKMKLEGKDLTGCQILIQFKANYGTKMAYQFSTFDNTILFTDQINGEFDLNLE